tara:strand:- start:892 stop:1773 length:882 start_codon:yes stop_codon:yes gene_type:complete
MNNACSILEIPYDERNNMKLIKTQYYKLSLKHHPDKNNGSKESKEYFQKINDSYHLLLNKKDDKNKLYDYGELLSSWICQFTNGRFSDIFMNIAQKIIDDYDISSKLFDTLSKEQSLEIYQFLRKHQFIFRLSKEKMEKISSIIKDKFKDDEIVIIHPTITDLLNNKVYKIVVKEQEFIVPCWHDELHFNLSSGGTLMVFCIPDVPKNISIDDHNNIYVKCDVPFDRSYMEENSHVSIPVENDLYSITVPSCSLILQKKQIVTLRSNGISKISNKDVFDISQKGNMYINLSFY